ncbi:MAG: T9SS type A sorting domain-containing protein [Flavobacteriales bacterium]|nr:T9SS type A sorting domain-containing protein [Flavobacteriales bacterium]
MKKQVRYLCIVLFGTMFSSHYYAQCDVGEAEVQIIIHTDDWGYECYWQLTSEGDGCGENTIVEGGNAAQIGCNGGGDQDATTAQGYEDNATIESEPFCLVLGNIYRLHYVDDYGDGGAHFEIMIGGFPIYEYMGTGQSGTFEFLVQEPAPFDVEGISVMTYSYMNPGPVPVKGKFFNRGSEVITSVEMSYQINGGAAIAATIDGLDVDTFTEFELTHPTTWNESTSDEYDLMIYITSINGNPDANMDDDEMERMVTIGPPIPNILDDYIGFIPETEQIAGSGESISNPRDIDFHPVLTRNELWVILKSTEASGGKTVKISNAGEGNQTELLQQDGNAWHFMSLPTGIAFSENENFATSPGVFDANHDGGDPFTGPTLWSSDPDIYAQESGGNGSHLDMLHESPYSMGIAHEVDNKFWVTCGDHNEIMSYDFQEDHGPGNSDHSDGIIYKYEITGYDEDSQHEVPDHLVFDKNTGWLYVCNSQQNRVIRINTNTGTPGADAVPHEAIEVYKYMEDFDWEVYIDFGLDEPTGIDIVEDRMIVSNYNTGDINLYDISNDTPILLTTIPTGSNGIMGVKVGPDGLIWYVNSVTDKVMRVTMTPVSVSELETDFAFHLNPNPAAQNVTFSVSNSLQLNKLEMKVLDMTGRVVMTEQIGSSHSFGMDVSALVNGVYTIYMLNDGTPVANEKLVVQH